VQRLSLVWWAWRRGPEVPAPFFWPGPGLSRVPVQPQLVMVRFETSQVVESPTLLSPLWKVTFQDTAWLVLTVKVVLVVANVLSAADVAFVSVFWYSCPLTALPEVAPQLSPV
jgi:hypothetical protein